MVSSLSWKLVVDLKPCLVTEEKYVTRRAREVLSEPIHLKKLAWLKKWSDIFKQVQGELVGHWSDTKFGH